MSKSNLTCRRLLLPLLSSLCPCLLLPSPNKVGVASLTVVSLCAAALISQFQFAVACCRRLAPLVWRSREPSALERCRAVIISAAHMCNGVFAVRLQRLICVCVCNLIHDEASFSLCALSLSHFKNTFSDSPPLPIPPLSPSLTPSTHHHHHYFTQTSMNLVC